MLVLIELISKLNLHKACKIMAFSRMDRSIGIFRSAIFLWDATIIFHFQVFNGCMTEESSTGIMPLMGLGPNSFNLNFSLLHLHLNLWTLLCFILAFFLSSSVYSYKMDILIYFNSLSSLLSFLFSFHLILYSLTHAILF